MIISWDMKISVLSLLSVGLDKLGQTLLQTNNNYMANFTFQEAFRVQTTAVA